LPVAQRDRKVRRGKPRQMKAGTGHDDTNDLYGHRVEADRSRTLHRAFTGVPASLDERAWLVLAGRLPLTRMLAMNRRNSGRQMRG
jgi:hypothetical protein